ncbi:glycoside hydrolase family 15 protein [Curtobacterium oceanosedimentum]|uniref:glycoside hydrolase family 15 protein n=1 Tax=Curtobacterium oceanosedimentum TaxID=465820 RepID=UPI001CE11E78|nr:glycoside hydrolase family 15 protein [Curtobacterium oceanosedimentum]MCA5923656.1 glycoside hydrolase family 15 protein [Curtobacterium oceanosedimentum]
MSTETRRAPAPRNRIEDHALIGDTGTAVLVGRDGTIDWACLPRFDSPSTFASLLGTEEHGHWTLRPVDDEATADRHYDGDTLVLSTVWTTAEGVVEVTEFMPVGAHRPSIVRRVRGLRGTVRMRQTLRIRFDYARALPWIRQVGDDGGPALVATAGPGSVVVRGPRFRADDHRHTATSTVHDGDVVDTVLTWYPSHREPPAPFDVDAALEQTRSWWTDWIAPVQAAGPFAAATRRSLVFLRAMTHGETGGVVAAATTSLPEDPGGERNWDYRYVWLRDASLALASLIAHGYRDEATHWRGWLLRAIAGDPGDVQIVYGIAGERELPERVLPELPGYAGSTPVRVGNGASEQYQGDVFGEVLAALHDARELGVEENADSWALQRALLGHVEQHWQDPDNGIWEMRGPRRHFTHSRAMIWAAFDRGVAAVEEFGLEGPVDRWRALREQVRAEIEEHGWNAARGCYRQHYDTDEVDASLLVLPQIGYLPADDPRMTGTVAAIEQDLRTGPDGLLLRYRTAAGFDGLSGSEHPFLACSFWLVEQYAASGRVDDAERLMEVLVASANDVGMLSEEIDVATGHHIGNTPQVLSHLTLVSAADAIERTRGRAVGHRTRLAVHDGGTRSWTGAGERAGSPG